MNEITHPPCASCNAHDELERHMKSSQDQNKQEHNEILSKLEASITNVRWMKTIGAWILTTMLGYYIVIGYYIFTTDHVTSSEIINLTNEVKHGEKLHYENENQISNINGKLDFVIKEITKE